MSFLWSNQTTEKENWEQITNIQNKTFKLPPKRYVIHVIKEKNENTNNNTTNKQNKFNTNRHSHKIRSRTLNPIDITLSDNDISISTECIMDIPKKYKQQNNKTKHYSKNNTHTPPIQSGVNIHPGSNRKFAIQNIQHRQYININAGTITNRRERAITYY
jgi:hypothetical protein